MERFPAVNITIRKNKPYNKNDIYYLEGSINCNGEGSIYLDASNGFKVTLTMPPGEYEYKLFRNQYHQASKRKKKILRYNGYYFCKDSNYSSYGYSLYFIYSKDEIEIEILKGISKIRERGSIRKNYGYIYYILAKSQSTVKIRIKNDIYELNSERNQPSNSSKIIYQIFPDRFFRFGEDKVDNLKEWGSAPDYKSFYGGNLRGITEKLDYLKKLNIDYIYLNPIFKSHSNHRYDVDDYFEVDPLLGRKKDFKDLVRKAHSLDIKIMMDMVFNHTSTHHKFFKDVLKKGKESNFYNYYIFHEPRFEIFPGHCNFVKGENECPSYETFMGYGGMPKLNLRNEEVKSYLMKVMDYWVNNYKVDGIRYDVANSLPLEFIRDLVTKHRNLIHIGEVWCASPIFAIDGYYDGITNYFLRDIIISYVKRKINEREFLESYYEFLFIYGKKADSSMNLLSSHDVQRIMTFLDENVNSVLLAYTILFMMNGYSMIYYGDEVGMIGGNDPDCRRTFPWEGYNRNILGYFRRLTKLRKRYGIMKGGILSLTEENGVYELCKISEEQELILHTGWGNRIFKLKGRLLIGRSYKRIGNNEIKIENNGFVLEILSKLYPSIS